MAVNHHLTFVIIFFICLSSFNSQSAKSAITAFRCALVVASRCKMTKASNTFLGSTTTAISTPPMEAANLYQGIHESSSSLTLLEHVNLNIPEHKYALPFYLDILGFGLDPRRAQNVVKGSGTVWVNCGLSQFHLPSGDTPQVIPGSIGLAYRSLEPLKERLVSAASQSDKPFQSYDVGIDTSTGREYVKIVDVYGNIFFARERRSEEADDSNNNADDDLFFSHLKPQPTIEMGNADHIDMFGEELVTKYGKSGGSSECLGIDYVEFRVPQASADLLQIAQFYEFALDAAVAIVQDSTINRRVAIVGFGKISQGGRPSQCLLFREDDGELLPPYDGHHVALYVGRNSQDFGQIFKQIEQADIVWVNPRFTDKATDLSGAMDWKQFRFKDILDLNTGNVIFTLEHEVRSVEHEAWLGKIEAIDQNIQ